MKKIQRLFSLVLAVLFSTNCFANCDFKTGIKINADGSRTYSEECHRKVGEVVQDLDIAKKQNDDYVKAIQLKDLTIKIADEREKNWNEVSLKMEARIEEIDKLRKQQEWIYYGLGVLTVIGLGYASSQLHH